MQLLGFLSNLVSSLMRNYFPKQPLLYMRSPIGGCWSILDESPNYSMGPLQRVWHASRERLPFQTPGSVPLFGTYLCSNCWDQFPRTCYVLTLFFTLNTPWYFLDFDCLSVNIRTHASHKVGQEQVKCHFLYVSFWLPSFCGKVEIGTRKPV